MTFPPLIIWAKATFFFEQLFPVVARTWFAPRSVCLFFGPIFRFLVKKSDFCHTTPVLVDDPFLALGMTVNFPPWDRFFDFPFRSYSSFCKKKLLHPSKSLPPPHCGGTIFDVFCFCFERWHDYAINTSLNDAYSRLTSLILENQQFSVIPVHKFFAANKIIKGRC